MSTTRQRPSAPCTSTRAAGACARCQRTRGSPKGSLRTAPSTTRRTQGVCILGFMTSTCVRGSSACVVPARVRVSHLAHPRCASECPCAVRAWLLLRCVYSADAVCAEFRVEPALEPPSARVLGAHAHSMPGTLGPSCGCRAGFHVVQTAEGCRDAAAMIFTHCETAPEFFVYDNACSAGQYCLNRCVRVAARASSVTIGARSPSPFYLP